MTAATTTTKQQRTPRPRADRKTFLKRPFPKQASVVYRDRDNTIARASELHEAATMKQLVREWLDIVASGPEQAWLARAAEDIVIRLPFAPPGIAHELRGRAQGMESLGAIWKAKERFDWHDVTIRTTEDPELFLVTARSEVLLRTGQHYANGYVMLTRVQGGKIVEHVEYFNPLPVMEAFPPQGTR
jgi:ketosteroid isomerase-like protein